jgi:hypothetical protein
VVRDARRPLAVSGLVLAAAVTAAVAGVAADAAGADVAQAVRADLAYTCAFTSGNAEVAATITTTFTPAARVGQPIAPVGVRIAARLPHQVLAGLSELGATSVSGTETLTVIEASRATAHQVPWQATTTQPTAIPATAALTVTATGIAPVTKATAPGMITFTPSILAFDLQGRRSDGSPAAQARLQATCVLASGSQTRLASISVTAAQPSPGPSGGRKAGKPPVSRGRFPKGCAHIKRIGTGEPTCGYITGYADVAKLIGAALLQPERPAKPALANVDFAERHKFKPGKLIEVSTAELYYKGLPELPPVSATFLAFRFVPVTATLHLTELNPIKIVSVSGIVSPPYPITVTATTKVALRVTNVYVNGAPLPVGNDCHIASPLMLTVVGKGDNTLPPKGYTVPTGGPLSGKVSIPPFVDCGVAENLDPLLTGSISGRGNFVKMTQGKLCGPSQPASWVCPPPVPKPQH